MGGAVHTKYSSVLGISRIDFIPADITVTGVLPSSVRSEEISIAVYVKKLKKETKLKKLKLDELLSQNMIRDSNLQ